MKTAANMVDINPTLSIIIQDGNSLNAPIQDRLSEWS